MSGLDVAQEPQTSSNGAAWQPQDHQASPQLTGAGPHDANAAVPAGTLHGSGGAPTEAAALQSHWVEGGAPQKPASGGAGQGDEGPKSDHGVFGSAGGQDHAELTKALDSPSEQHAEESAGKMLASPAHSTGGAQAPAQSGRASPAPAKAEGPVTDLTINDTSSHKRTFTDAVYKHNEAAAASAHLNVTDPSMKGDLAAFKANWQKNQGRYEAVAAQTGVPAKLIAAIHWREASGNFNTYLHQGDPLGKPAVHVPRNIPIFYKWEDAAVNALNMKKGTKNDLGMTEKTTDLTAMATYSEFYNGLGYYHKGRVSPYVFSGTDKYSKGKYVGDGVYDPNAKDRQLGTVALLESISGSDVKPGQKPAAGGPEPAQKPPTTAPGHAPPAAGSAPVSAVDMKLLRPGDKGEEVKSLQTMLHLLGAPLEPDGDFGPATTAAVKDFQKKHGLTADGFVGSPTKLALQKAVASHSEPPAAPTHAPTGGTPAPGAGATQSPGAATGSGHAPNSPSAGTTSEPAGTKGLAEERAQIAAKSARLLFDEGRKVYGEGSWETWGANQGPLVNKIKETNFDSGKNEDEWCGMTVGFNYARAGIRKEILKNLVFWSGYRLHLFLTAGGYLGGKAGSWWGAHHVSQIGEATGAARKSKLDAYGPQAGDIVLFRADYSHVGMVESYDPATGTLECIEGNSGNRVRATVHGTGHASITFIGRLNSSDYEPGGSPDKDVVNAQDVKVNHAGGTGSTH